MIRQLARKTMLCFAGLALLAVAGVASDAQLFFSSDKSGQTRVTNVQEGSEIWIVVVDPDENTDCDLRDKIWTDVKLMDPKTGAVMEWERWEDPLDTWPYDYRGNDGCTSHGHFLEETAADSGVFVSNRPIRIGQRIQVNDGFQNTHWVGPDFDGIDSQDVGHWDEFGERGAVGDWLYAAGDGSVRETPDVPIFEWDPAVEVRYHARFENMDSLWGMYQDPDDRGDVAVAMMKIIDTEAAISWNRDVYPDGNAAATITVIDPDENLDCSAVEAVPVFILVNPGSWNPVDLGDWISPTTFCMLKRTGGVDRSTLTPSALVWEDPIRWFNIYNNFYNADRRYYIQYPTATAHPDSVTQFDTDRPDGVTPVSFYAWETGPDTGVFQLNLNSIYVDLEFNSLNVRDVLVAYYLDPNDFDDFKLAAATIEEQRTSVVSFTDAARANQEIIRLGRDSVYLQVIDANANVDPCCPEQVLVHVCDPHCEDDAEWLVLDEASSNAATFITAYGMSTQAVWDALGIGLAGTLGGYRLQLDNWTLEAFNEDDVYARYNDVVYGAGPAAFLPLNRVEGGLADVGDADPGTSFPPWIAQARVPNDVSFDLMSISDTQVYDGTTTRMGFLDRQGNRVLGYVNSDCVFIEVVDPDQDEDSYRRERIDAFWDGGQNWPVGPMPLNEFICDGVYDLVHPVNELLGDTNILGNSPAPYDVNFDFVVNDGAPKIYVLNPRNGRWAAVDLLETGPASGEFVSVICVDLSGAYDCAPTLGVQPGDTILAAYQDPSNHSDSAVISIKVGIGGATPPGQASTTAFVDADGNDVASYADTDAVYVRVVDPSHVGAPLLSGALTVEGMPYDLYLDDDEQPVALAGAPGTFMTGALDLDLTAGSTITANYTDPSDPMDTSSDSAAIVGGKLAVERFYASPTPFEDRCTFGYAGAGLASILSIEIYDLAGRLVWTGQLADAAEIVWDGLDRHGDAVANGPYLYVAMATDGTDTFTGNGLLFRLR